MKKNKIVIALLLVPIIIVTSSMSVFADVKLLGVTQVMQAYSNWCWAACCEMAGNYAKTSNRTQFDVVHYLKGTTQDPYPNVGGSLSDSETGSEYVTYNQVTFWAYGISKSSALSMTQIRSFINSNKPLEACVGFYDNSGVRTGGHMVVICGAYTDSDQLYYIDPWNGGLYQTTYIGFCNGYVDGGYYDGTVYY